jgi:hypothetical protein
LIKQPQIDLDELRERVERLELPDDLKKEVWNRAKGWAVTQHTQPNLDGLVSLVKNQDRLRTPTTDEKVLSKDENKYRVRYV